MSTNITLIDFKALGDVINNLIDKLASAVGWVATRDTPARVAEKTYIDEIRNSNLPPIEKAALISHAKESIKEYSNQYAVIARAIKDINEDAKPQEVEDDWLLRFMNKVKYVSNEEFQIIWAKLLAKECNDPGTVPRSLLYTLERMDKEDAEIFYNLSCVTVRINDSYVPLVNFNKSEKYEKYGIQYGALLQLESLGLIKIRAGLHNTGLTITCTSDIPEEEVRARITYFANEFLCPQKMETIEVGNVVFSKDGGALYEALNPQEAENFWNQIALPWFNASVQNWEKNKSEK